MVTGQLRSLARPERRSVRVLAACRSGQYAGDGRLSTAVDEVLRGFASGTPKLDASVPYVPITRFCREAALHVESRSTTLNPQSVEQPLAALGADLSYRRFFASPPVPAGSLRTDAPRGTPAQGTASELRAPTRAHCRHAHTGTV